MPKQFHPRSRGVHRIACIALYRALLSKCSKIEVSDNLKRSGGRGGQIHPVAEIIQKQFRRNRKYESQTLVGAALRIGYEAEELLHNAVNGSEEAHWKILSLVEAYQAESKSSLARNALSPPPRHPQQLHISPSPIPGAPKLLESRPRPLHSSAINRVRSVPKLVSANGVPFLRYQKKQSPFLTRVINDKRMTRTKRHETMNKMHAQGEMGSVSWAEEIWDGLVSESVDASGSGGSGERREKVRKLGQENRGKKNDKRDGMGTWRESFLISERHQSTMLNVEKARNRQYALKMTEILEEEKRLHDIEKGVVEREKRNERNKAKRLRRTEEERTARKQLLDSLSPEEREKEVERFRKELQERKKASEMAKAEKAKGAKRFGKEELGEIARSGWGVPAAAPSRVTFRTPAMSPTPTVSPVGTHRLASVTKAEEQRRRLDEKRIAIAEKSTVRREATKELATGKAEKKGGVLEAKHPAEGGFTISWGRGRPDRERGDKIRPARDGKRDDGW